MKSICLIVSASLTLWATGSIADCVGYFDFESGVVVEQAAEPNQLIYRRENGGLVLELPDGVEADSGSIVQSMIIGHPMMLTEVRFNEGTFQQTEIVRARGDWETLPETGEWLAFVNFVARDDEELGGSMAFYFAQFGEQIIGDCSYETWVVDVSAQYDNPLGNNEYRLYFSPELEFPIRLETRNRQGRFTDMQRALSLQRLR